MARYPHIDSPDTKGKYADNKYKVKLVLPIGSDEAQALVQQIKDAAVSIHGPKGLDMHMPFVEDEEAGETVFTFKTQYAPGVFDSRGNNAMGVRVGGGSVIRLMGNLVEFDKGITAQMNQVQIKSLSNSGTCAFGAVDDGYEVDPSDVRSNTSGGFAGRDADDGDTGEGSTANGRSALDI